MRGLFIGLFALFSVLVHGQIDRTGKDSISPSFGLLKSTEIFSTSEIQGFTRVGPNDRAVALNSDTGTWWYWDGTVWTNMLDIDASELNIIIDQVISNGSTNPVENNAIFDRFVNAVDESAVSPFKDIELYYGDREHFEANKASLGPRYIAFVSDSIFDPSPTGSGIDGMIQNVQLINQTLDFTAVGGGFDGQVDLSSITSGSNTDDQILTQLNFNNTNYDLTIGIENGNNLSTGLDKLWQDADDVEINDSNIPIPADDVQELINDMFASGSGTALTTIADEYTNSVLSVENMQYEWERNGSLVWFNAVVTINLSATSPGVDYNVGGRFLFTIPALSGGLPIPNSTLGTPNTVVNVSRAGFFVLPSSADTYECNIRADDTNSNTDIYLNWSSLTPQGINATGAVRLLLTAVYRTRDFN